MKKISGQDFDKFLNKHFYVPMGIERLTFNPSYDYEKKEIVPTEIDSLLEKLWFMVGSTMRLPA